MIGLLILGGVTIISMIRGLVFQHKLWEHLRKNHDEKWNDLTFIGKWGLGIANGRKAIVFLFSREDLNDAEVLRLKVITRNSFILQLAGFVTLFLWASFMTNIIIR
jgi:hypothetical protein